MSDKKTKLGIGLLTGLGGLFLANRWSHQTYDQSLPSYLVNLLLKKVDIQHLTNKALDEKDLDQIDDLLTKANRRPVSNPYSRWSFKGSEHIYKGMQVFTWNDSGDEDQDILLYFHGGGYVRYPLLFHMNMIQTIGRRSGCKIIMPVYPKAPEFTYKEAFPPLMDLYQELLKSKGNQAKLFLLGDSAGGGLALGFSYFLKDRGIQQPDYLTLLSPWLDLSNSHKNIKDGFEREVFFGHEPLNYAGLRWAGGEETLSSKYVSPINGQVTDLDCLVSLYIGSHEALYYDTLDLAEQLEEAQLLDSLHIGENQHHDWLLYPTPEARRARKEIADRLALMSKR